MMIQIANPRGYYWKVGDIIYRIEDNSSMVVADTQLSYCSKYVTAITEDDWNYVFSYNKPAEDVLLLRRIQVE